MSKTSAVNETETIEQISSRSREDILAKLAEGYQDPEISDEIPEDPVNNVVFSGDLYTNMVNNMRSNKFEVHEVKESEVIDTINSIARSYNARKLLYPASLKLDMNKIEAAEKQCFDQEIEKIREQVFTYDFSIIEAKYGVSSHGIVCLCSTPEQPRMLSLAPPLCIMLLKKDKVVKGITEALAKVKAENKERLPTNILFIAGPSRTADIELITVFGVHGSQSVHIILY